MLCSVNKHPHGPWLVVWGLGLKVRRPGMNVTPASSELGNSGEVPGWARSAALSLSFLNCNVGADGGTHRSQGCGEDAAIDHLT